MALVPSTPSELSITISTRAEPWADRLGEPAKMTSAIEPPRTFLGEAVPSTQARASTTLDLPDPLGPTMTVMPGSTSITVLSAKDLKPRRLSDVRNTWTPSPGVRTGDERHGMDRGKCAQPTHLPRRGPAPASHTRRRAGGPAAVWESVSNRRPRSGADASGCLIDDDLQVGARAQVSRASSRAASSSDTRWRSARISSSSCSCGGWRRCRTGPWPSRFLRKGVGAPRRARRGSRGAAGVVVTCRTSWPRILRRPSIRRRARGVTRHRTRPCTGSTAPLGTRPEAVTARTHRWRAPHAYRSMKSSAGSQPRPRLDLLDARITGSALTHPRLDLLDGVGGPLQVRLDPSVGQVAHPPDHPGRAGALPGGGAEEHALHTAADAHVPGVPAATCRRVSTGSADRSRCTRPS